MLKLFDDKITIEQEIIQTQSSTQVWNNIPYIYCMVWFSALFCEENIFISNTFLALEMLKF